MAILSIGELLGMGPSELSGLIPYSGLEYSGSVITGISGSALGGTNSATVSAIASAYAESAVSSKVDQSAFNDCCSAVNSALSGISAAVSGVTGNTGTYLPASASGDFQPSGDYAFNSSVSGKQDASGMSAYALSSDVSGVVDTVSANSASWGGGGGTGDYVEKSAIDVTIGSLNTAYNTSFVQGVENIGDFHSLVQGSANVAITRSFAHGRRNSAHGHSFAQGDYNFGSAEAFAQGSHNKASGNSFAQGGYNSASGNSFAQGGYNSASGKSFAQGSYNTASADSLAQGYYNSASDNSFAQGTSNTATGNSFAQGSNNKASGNSFAQGAFNIARNTVAVFGTYNLHWDGSTSSGDSAAFVIGDGTASAGTAFRHDLMVVTKNGEITMYSSTADTTGIGLVSSIRALSSSVTGDMSGKLDVSAVNFDGDSSHVTGISGVPLSAQGGGGGISFPMDIYIEDSASAILDTGTYRLSEYDWMNGALVLSAFDDYSCHAAFIATRGSAEYSTAASAFYTEEGIRLYTGNSVEGTRIDADGVMTDSIYADNGYFKSLGTNGSTASAFSLDSAGVSGRSGAQSSWILTPSGTEGYGWKLNKTGVSGSGWKFGSSEYDILTSMNPNLFVEKSAIEVTIGSANTASSTAIAQGLKNSAYFDSFAQGRYNTASDNSFSQGYYNTASSDSFAQGHYNTASGTSFAQGLRNSANSNSFAQGQYNSAYSNSFAHGYYNSAKNTAAVFGQYNLHGDGNTATGNSAAFAIGDGTANNARHDLMLVTKDGEITMYSSTADTVGLGIVSSIKAISAAGGGSSKLDVSSVNFNGDSSYVTGISGIPLSASDVSGKLDVSSVNFNGDSSRVTGISGIPLYVSSIPLTSTDGSVIITNQGTYADVIVTGTTGDLTVSGISILGLYRWATSQGYQP